MKINAEKVKIAMANKCMSMRELSKKTGLKEETVSAVLSNKREARLTTVGVIAKVLGKTVEEIIEEG